MRERGVALRFVSCPSPVRYVFMSNLTAHLCMSSDGRGDAIRDAPHVEGVRAYPPWVEGGCNVRYHAIVPEAWRMEKIIACADPREK